MKATSSWWLEIPGLQTKLQAPSFVSDLELAWRHNISSSTLSACRLTSFEPSQHLPEPTCIAPRLPAAPSLVAWSFLFPGASNVRWKRIFGKQEVWRIQLSKKNILKVNLSTLKFLEKDHRSPKSNGFVSKKASKTITNYKIVVSVFRKITYSLTHLKQNPRLSTPSHSSPLLPGRRPGCRTSPAKARKLRLAPWDEGSEVLSEFYLIRPGSHTRQLCLLPLKNQNSKSFQQTSPATDAHDPAQLPKAPYDWAIAWSAAAVASPQRTSAKPPVVAGSNEDSECWVFKTFFGNK